MFGPYENNMTKPHVSKEATTRWPKIHTTYHITNANFLSWHRSTETWCWRHRFVQMHTYMVGIICNAQCK